MSQTRRWSGVLLMGAGAAVGAFTYRATIQGQAAAGRAAAAAASASAALAAQQLQREERALEAKVMRAVSLKPLNAALENRVDGPTLLDLFEHEDWWQPFREEMESARVIVGDNLLAAWGKVDLGLLDRQAVQQARKQRLASAQVTMNNRRYLIAAARFPALPEREPVLVLARLAPVVSPGLASPTPTSPLRLTDDPIPLALAGGLVLSGLGLLLSSRGRRSNIAGPGAAGDAGTVSANRSPGTTMRFGTPARPQPARPTTGALRPPVAAGPDASVSIPESSTVDSASGAAVQASAPQEDSGRTFGRYRLLDRLGEGGMSEIFTAEATGVEGFTRTFVLKRLRPELAHDKAAVEQFIDEARLQAGLVHSNIVPVFDFGMFGSEYFMTQEYIVGRDLLRLIMRHQEHSQSGIEPRLAYYLAYETLQALAYAHDKCDKGGEPMGIVHRDVSPANVMISLRGEVKLSDFGIVKANLRVSRTQMGMVKGNANFMSPEQARGQHVDARSDLFSLAALLYYCLSDELLYRGDNDLDVLYKAAQGPTEEDQSRIMQLPEPAAAILGKALSIDPAQRFQTASEFADVLAAHASGGRADAVRVMQLLFGDELRLETA
jgi:hypothetical protein